MAILEFAGNYDAYFWVLCTEKYFKVRNIPEQEKMSLGATGMRGCALKWWRWWSPRHPEVSWDTFTTSFLWRFKPEYRAILPFDEEEEPNQELPPLIEFDDSSNDSLNNVLRAWDAFLLSTDEIEVPPTSVVDCENVDLLDATTNELMEKPKSWVHFADSFDFEPFIVESESFALASVVEHGYHGKKETTMDTDNKGQSSLVVIDIGVFNIVVALTQHDIRLADPPDLVPIPPPPLAPPWINHSPYPEPLDSLPIIIESNTYDSFQHGQEVLTRIPSLFDNPIALQVITLLRKCSVSDASILTHVCLLPFPILISLTTASGFLDFGISAPHTYQLFVERPLQNTRSWNIILFQYMNTLSARLQNSSQKIKLSLGNVLFDCNTFESLLLGTQGMTSLVQNYSAISGAFKFCDVSLGLSKLVHNGHSNLSSFLVVNPFGYIASPYGYMRALDCYSVFLLEVLIGKTSMERIMSFIFSFHKPTMQHVTICRNLPLVDDYAAHSIVSLICNGRRHTSIPVANFGVEGDHIIYADSALQNHLEFLEEFSSIYHSDQVVLERWLNYVLHLFDWLYKSCGSLLLFTFENRKFQDFIFPVIHDGWKNNNKNLCEFDYGTKSLVQFIGFDNLSQGPIFHEIIQYVIFSRCMLSCDKYARMSHMRKATLFNIDIVSKPIVIIFIELEDKIIFRGVGNDMIYVVLVSCLVTNMFYNEDTIGKNKDVEVEKLRKTRHKRINRLWCCYKSDNNSSMGILNDKKSLLDWHYNYSTLIVIDAAEGLVYLHHNCVLPIVHNMRSKEVLSGVFEGKVADTGAAKIVSFASKVVVFMYVTMESYGYTALVRWRKRKMWDPGWNLNMCIASWSSKFKQWDPGKICAVSNFYNLEDKVDFEGVGNVMILEAQIMSSPKIK